MNARVNVHPVWEAGRPLWRRWHGYVDHPMRRTWHVYGPARWFVLMLTSATARRYDRAAARYHRDQRREVRS
jgi:hypothetical protein